MTYLNIKTELLEGILHITINRENKLNALNKETLRELADVIQYVQKVPEVHCALITGAGEKAFVAGADISEFSSFKGEEGENLARNGQVTVFDAIENSTKPFLAAINGYALGGGLELALACHLRIAADTAKMGLPETTLGLIPGYGGTQRLTQLVGKGRAFEIIATADMITAEKAAQIGLVNYTVPPEELIPRSVELLKKIMSRAPVAIAAAINATNSVSKHNLDGYELEIKEFGRLFDTQDFKEGTRAFAEKRKAVFKGN